jgi:hypothetical protein
MVGAALAYRYSSDFFSSVESGVDVYCVREITAPCKAAMSGLDGLNTALTRDAGVTVDRLVSQGSLDEPGWAYAPSWMDIVDARRAGQPRLLPHRVELASSRVALVMWKDRAAVLQKACGAITWSCAADALAKGTWDKSGGKAEWGRVKIGIDDPTQSGSGLAALGALAMSSFNGTDFGRADIESNPDYQRRRSALASSSADPSLSFMLAGGPAVVDAVSALGPDLAAAQGSPRFADVVVVYPAPVSRITVSLATAPTPSGDRLARRLSSRLTDRLVAAGWDRPAPAAFPDGGVLAALLDDWTAGR